jgi:hypothetical protein
MSWLRSTVRPQENRKATLLLSHHQYFTAFGDHGYTRPAKQLREFFRHQEIIWIWGHEHRLAIYDRFTKDGGLTVFGRCLGNGGMPVDVDAPDAGKAPVRYYDARCHWLDDGTPVGQNGYANVVVDRDTLWIEYRDIDDNLLLTETFIPQAGGRLRHTVDDSAGILRKV